MKLSELAKKRMPTHGMKEALDIRYFYRWISLPITYMLYHLGFTANMVSILMMAFSVYTAFLIVSGKVILGIALWQFWLVLDSVDGEIARLKNECCASGWFLDLVFENICFPINFIALGLWLNPQPPIGWIGWILAILWITGIAVRYNYLECLGNLKNAYIKSRDNRKEKIIRYLTYGEFKTVVAFFALIFAIFNLVWLFLILLLFGLMLRTLLQTMILYVSLKRT